MTIAEKIMALTKQLLPSGRAFWMPVGGYFEKLMTGLQASEARAYDDAVSILNSALPDNDSFTADDATAWEKRLGLITNPLVQLSDRKLAIQRKMAHPGLIPARQNYLYLQGQLQAAGFDVYVYENRFVDYFAGYVTKTPAEFSTLPYPVNYVQLGQVQLGQRNLGGNYANRVINNIDETLDYSFSTGPTFRSTFFIGGPTPGSWAVVDANRKDEFRQLVLKIKPVQMVGYLLISFY
jgi:hypothetical protein